MSRGDVGRSDWERIRENGTRVRPCEAIMALCGGDNDTSRVMYWDVYYIATARGRTEERGTQDPPWLAVPYPS